jgi:hypothetical protein
MTRNLCGRLDGGTAIQGSRIHFKLRFGSGTVVPPLRHRSEEVREVRWDGIGRLRSLQGARSVPGFRHQESRLGHMQTLQQWPVDLLFLRRIRQARAGCAAFILPRARSAWRRQPIRPTFMNLKLETPMADRPADCRTRISGGVDFCLRCAWRLPCSECREGPGDGRIRTLDVDRKGNPSQTLGFPQPCGQPPAVTHNCLRHCYWRFRPIQLDKIGAL